MFRFFALTALLVPSLAMAEMPALPNDAIPQMAADCTDKETGNAGTCYLFRQPTGDIWMVFTQNGEPQFVRYVEVGQPYLTVWMAVNYSTF